MGCNCKIEFCDTSYILTTTSWDLIVVLVLSSVCPSSSGVQCRGL